MGAPKQKWTAEEEAALKAGVRKHGAGKWRTILTDPEFGQILSSRSNVDLKDKWRNINVMANGLGSRSKARLAIKKSQSASKHGSNSLALTTVPQVEDAKPLSSSGGTRRISGAKESIARLDKLILEAITKLGDPNGSDKAEISMYIEERYWSPPNLKRVLSAKLKDMAGTGQLIKEKRKYRIAPCGPIFGVERSPPLLLLEGKQQDSSRPVKNGVTVFSKSQIDVELSKMRSMTAHEAALAAARAVAEAEAAIAEAEEAAREADAAEAEAEEAQVFATAALKALQCGANHIWCMDPCVFRTVF